MSLLLLFAGGGTFVPIVSDPQLVIITPDEVATGVEFSLWIGYVDNTGTPGTVDDGPHVAVYKGEADGTLTAELGLAAASALGDGFVRDWTPSESGTYLVTAAADADAAIHAAMTHISARPKFDPIALALYEQLVSRM